MPRGWQLFLVTALHRSTRQAGPALMSCIEQCLEEQAEIDDVIDLRTMGIGTDQVLVCAPVDFVDSFSAADLEHACMRIDADLRGRVLARYGRIMAQH